ncbi:MAG TPA: DMT family transporter [Chlamydiales bacterium]|jgi:drug/metabolite transporter (DMT)-like permease
MSQQRISFGISIALVAYLFFAMASSLVFYFQGRFPTIQIIFIQNVVAFFCILPMALRRGLRALKTDELPTHLMRDLFGLLSYYLFFLAIRFLNLVDATTLNYTAPFFVPFVAWVWMKEKIDSHIWWSIVLGFFGVAIVLNPTKEIFQLGFVFGIFAGITSAVALTSVRRLNLKKEPMSRTLFYFFAISAILSFPFAWASWVPPSSNEWLLCCAIGTATALGQILLTLAYRHGTASYLSPLGYAVVIYNALISYFVFEKSLGWRSLAGTSLIIFGGLLTYLWKTKSGWFKKKENPPL